MRRERGPAPLLAVDPAELLRDDAAVSHPVLRVILERVRAGSRPRARADGHRVCLAVEGGGMRGAVSAGMCVVLEAAGLMDAFDCVYGVSAGALNGSAAATGQAAFSATRYQDVARRGVINRARPLIGRPVIDAELLFGDLVAARKPLSFAALASGPEFRALATSLDAPGLRVLGDFRDVDELTQAVRASAALPLLGGRPPVFRGERMADGAMIEAIPYTTALREGATHVLVLRSRPAGYRKPPHTGMAERAVVRRVPAVRDLVAGHRDAYNRQAAELERLTARGDASPVLQLTVPEDTRLIGHLDANPARVIETLRLGAAAVAQALLVEPIELCWQPVAYRTRPPTALTTPRRAAPADWRTTIRRAFAQP